jgi:hypothetical protein
MKPLEECLRVLGLPRSATPRQITTAFRRLAKRYHPDVSPTPEARRCFIEVVEAYQILRENLRLRQADSDCGRCPRCGQHADLFDALDGGRGCADCLLGRTYLRRFLPPLPVVVVAKHLSVFALYAACVFFLICYLNTSAARYALTSLLSVTTGMVVLAAEVLSVARATLPARRPRPAGARV